MAVFVADGTAVGAPPAAEGFSVFEPDVPVGFLRLKIDLSLSIASSLGKVSVKLKAGSGTIQL